MIFARIINRIAEFYMIFARKMPEFYVIIAGKKYFFLFFFFLGGGSVPPAPVSYTPLSASGPNPSLCPWMDNGHSSTFQSVPPPLVWGHTSHVSFLSTPSASRSRRLRNYRAPREWFPGPRCGCRLAWLKIERTLLLTAYIVIDEVSNGLNDLSNI